MTGMPGIFLMVPGIMFQVLLIRVITGKSAHKPPERFDLVHY